MFVKLKLQSTNEVLLSSIQDNKLSAMQTQGDHRKTCTGRNKISGTCTGRLGGVLMSGGAPMADAAVRLRSLSS